MSIRVFIAFCAAFALLTLCVSCRTTEQVRKGYSVRPINSPAAWETNPYSGAFQN